MAYIELADLSDEGAAVMDAVGKKRAEKFIRLACAYFDKVTGQWFDDRQFKSDAPLLLDGTGTSTLYLGVPIISIESILIDGEEIDQAGVRIYNRRFPDDRGNPKLVRLSRFGCQSDYGPVWPKGHQNIGLVGHFGYLDWAADNSRVTPEPVKRAVLKLAMRELPKLGTGDGMLERKIANAKSETTDGHSYTLADIALTGALTGDSEIDNVIAAYRAPLICEVL